MCQVDLTSDNLSRDLKRGKRVGWSVNLSSWLVRQVELVTASRICHLRKAGQKKIGIASALEKMFAGFGLRVLVCLKSVFSDGQDVKYDRDITPHPHLFRGTNSHEYSVYRDNKVNKKRTDPPSQDPGEGFFRQLAHVILGGSPFKLNLTSQTWQVDLTCQVTWREARGEGDQSTWQAQLVKFHIYMYIYIDLSSSIYTCIYT